MNLSYRHVVCLSASHGSAFFPLSTIVNARQCCLMQWSALASVGNMAALRTAAQHGGRSVEHMARDSSSVGHEHRK